MGQTNVIPFKRYQQNRLVPVTEPRVPEPAQLYSLICLALVLHTPVTYDGLCGQCGRTWPCPQAILAWRLREGF